MKQAVIYIFCIIIPLQSAYGVMPIIETLADKQQIKHHLDAPSGDDPPLESSQIIPEPEMDTRFSEKEEQSVIEKKVAETSKSVSLEEKIHSQVIQGKLEQFGYDFFLKSPSTFAPVSNIPVPENYIVGPGDTIIIQLYGKINVEYSLVVTREGKLLIPDLGPVSVSGLTFDEVKKQLSDRFNKRIIGASTSITMGELRTIQIYIFGEVEKPGAYTISSLSTFMNALMVCGGIRRSGSLRNIFLKSNDRIIAELDFYDVLLNGHTSTGNIKLRFNNVIFVPPIGPTVGIAGEIQRPAIYELKNERTVKDMILIAGGFLPTASLTKAHIERIQNNEFKTLIDLDLSSLAKDIYSELGRGTSLAMEYAFAGPDTLVQTGDIIRIFPVSSTMDQIVLLGGHVKHPGGYQLKNAMRISDIISSKYDLLPNADLTVAILKRETFPQKKIRIYYVDLLNALQFPENPSNMFLQSRDELVVFNLADNRSKALGSLVNDLRIQKNPNDRAHIFFINGHVRFQGAFPLQLNARLTDVIRVSGGLLPGADKNYAVVTRPVSNNTAITMLPIHLTNESETFMVQPEDSIYIFDQTADRTKIIQKDIQKLIDSANYGQPAPVVVVNGWIKHPGKYPFKKPMTVSQLINAGGGLKDNAYGIRAEITRYSLTNDEYRITDHITLNLSDILSENTEMDMELSPYDHLTLHKKPGWTKTKLFAEIQGEIKFPGKYPIKEDETLSNLIWRAGGLTDQAYMFGAVFLRESVKEKQQKSLDKLKKNLDDLLVNIHLSPSVNNSEKMPASEHKHQIFKVIKQLGQVKASGRMVIDLDEAICCDSQKDIVLENGDQLYIPKFHQEVTVMGEVYYPSSHHYRKAYGCQDYIQLSGGPTVLARSDQAFVVQANGEIFSIRKGSWFNFKTNIPVTPGAIIFMPLNVDRINRLENFQSWTEIFYHLAISAASLSVVGVF